MGGFICYVSLPTGQGLFANTLIPSGHLHFRHRPLARYFRQRCDVGFCCTDISYARGQLLSFPCASRDQIESLNVLRSASIVLSGTITLKDCTCISLAVSPRLCMIPTIRTPQRLLRLPDLTSLKKVARDLSRNRDSFVLATDRAFLVFLTGSFGGGSWRGVFPDVCIGSMVVSVTAAKSKSALFVYCVRRVSRTL